MKAVINIVNFVVDLEQVNLLDELLRGAEKQDYDYAKEGSYYYIRPMETSGITISVLPSDLYEAQKLVWKLKQEAGAK